MDPYRKKANSCPGHVRAIFRALCSAFTVLFLAAALLLQVSKTFAADLFVAPTGSGTDCSRSAPCNLATAVSQAASLDAVYMAAGTYTGTSDPMVSLTESLSLYGGWDGAASGPIVRDPVTYQSVLDGEDARRVMHISGMLTVRLEGFTITRGVAVTGGAGLHSQNADLTISNMTFDSNVVQSDSGTVWGGGAKLEGGSLVVEDSTFRLNSAWAPVSCIGGGLAVIGAGPARVEDCTFYRNDSWDASGLSFEGPGERASLTLRNSIFHENGHGYSAGTACGGYAGAVRLYRAVAKVEGNAFKDNRASNDFGAVSVHNSELSMDRNVISGTYSYNTSGLYLSYVSSFALTNNLFVDNTSGHQSGEYPCVEILESSGELVHNTVARNSGAFGIRLRSLSSAKLTNNIIARHTVGITVEAGSSATLKGTLWGSGAWANDTDSSGAGTINSTKDIHGEPAFTEPDSGNYHILAESAARNAGVRSVVKTDMDGECRPQEGGFDIGADETGDGRCGSFLSPVFGILFDDR